MASRSSPDVRRASLLLSGLVLTGDDSLEAFRDRRVGDKTLDTAHLKRARDVLDAVHEAITAGDDARWQRLEEAWELLCNSPDDRPAADADRAPASSPSVAEAPPPPPHEASKPEPAPKKPAASPMSPSVAPAPVAPPPLSRPGGSPPRPVAPPQAVTPGSPAPMAVSAGPVGPSPWAQQNDGGAPASQRPAPPPPSPRKPMPAPAAAPAAAPPPVPAGINPSTVPNVKVAVSNATMPVDDQNGDRTVLPFAGTAAPPPSAVSDVKAAMDALGQTRMDDGPAKAVTLPFKIPPGGQPPATEVPPLPSHLSGLDLERYAALCAERDVYKGWESQVEARYGITSAADKKAVDAHFRAQLDADPAQMESWRKQYARVQAWAREQRGT